MPVLCWYTGIQPPSSLNNATTKRAMKIFLDSSNVDEITKAVGTGLIDGVTTNPSLMLKAGEDPTEILKQVCDLFSWDASVSAEVSGDTSEEMLDMADEYINIHPSITIKVPCNVAGLLACKDLKSDEIAVNVTLIFSVAQAILASKAGAKYVSPFVGRVQDNNFDGVQLVGDIVKTFETHERDTQILAASLRNVYDVSKCFQVGADIVTMPPKLFWGMYNHILTEKGLQIFNNDWEQVKQIIKEREI